MRVRICSCCPLNKADGCSLNYSQYNDYLYDIRRVVSLDCDLKSLVFDDKKVEIETYWEHN